MQPGKGVLSPHAEFMPILHPLYFLSLNWGYNITPTGMYFSNLWGTYYTSTTVISIRLLDRNMKTTSTHMKWGTYLH